MSIGKLFMIGVLLTSVVACATEQRVPQCRGPWRSLPVKAVAIESVAAPNPAGARHE